MTSPILFPLLADNPTLVFLRRGRLIWTNLTCSFFSFSRWCISISAVVSQFQIKKWGVGIRGVLSPSPPPKLTLLPVPLIPSFSSSYLTIHCWHHLPLKSPLQLFWNTSKLYSILKSRSNTGVPFLTLLSPLVSLLPSFCSKIPSFSLST